jgi:hypothetical protein
MLAHRTARRYCQSVITERNLVSNLVKKFDYSFLRCASLVSNQLRSSTTREHLFVVRPLHLFLCFRINAVDFGLDVLKFIRYNCRITKIIELPARSSSLGHDQTTHPTPGG